MEKLARFLLKLSGIKLPKELKITNEDKKRFKKDKNENSNIIIDNTYIVN